MGRNTKVKNKKSIRPHSKSPSDTCPPPTTPPSPSSQNEQEPSRTITGGGATHLIGFLMDKVSMKGLVNSPLEAISLASTRPLSPIGQIGIP